MYDSKLKQLDDIIKTTLQSIQDSKDEIVEISNFAKEEYIEIEEEFLQLKIEATNIINNVDELEKNLKESKKQLLLVNKNHQKYSEQEMKEIYTKTDSLRVALAVEREKENLLIKRRHDLELHLKNIRKISEKADKLNQNFMFAFSSINGELSKVSEEVDDISSIKQWGMKAIQIQEMERKRIARDMHDGPTQSLTNLILKTEICIKLLDKDIDQTKIELQTLRNLIRATIDDTRRLIYNLRPMSIDDLGLVPTLERYIDNTLSEQVGLKIDLNVTKYHEILTNPAITLTLFRVVQEALNNIIKHANATLVEINLTAADNNIALYISDNGDGFEPVAEKTNSETSGFGLIMIRERIAFLGGNIKIHSEVNKGTIIKVDIPVLEKENESTDEDD